ncbi:hypothetical protein A464_683 [Salmonella bongori N268-08]|uniref:Uncharacterized protein n=1 Tax=Salmonella bongori N268-08 TaxID=1197719 RepID=S5MT88_SALBN|nr:hypothetical protein A464_683 [Salmonella bongori N268-08]
MSIDCYYKKYIYEAGEYANKNYKGFEGNSPGIFSCSVIKHY